MKYGIFPNLSMSQFLFVIAAFGLAVYLSCAIIISSKVKSSEVNLSKALLHKKALYLYSLVIAAYLFVLFLLLITF